MRNPHSFGYWVRRQRKALDLTQAALAQKVGCAAITIRKIEAEERRPSRQMAARLAQVLGIDEEKRQNFIEMGRGERPVHSLTLPEGAVEAPPATPAWLAQAESRAEPGAGRPFVGREQELQQLSQHLQAALAGERHVALISGEAGQGKTSLMAEFARRAQAANEDLLVAEGNCTAYGGMGDPYLPFRAILSLLCGEIEKELNAGRIGVEGARRLWQFWPQAAASLVTLAPELLNVLVSPATLARRAAANGYAQTQWVERLNVMAERGDAGEQSHVFEQFTTFLESLAGQRPLLLLLDDLQWADSASLQLLFHLGRRLSGTRILLLGAYRPSDVASEGAEGNQPFALPEIVNELKRRYGEIVIDLDRLELGAGRGFVDALLDREANRLDDDFRVRLFWRTRGHPLFTVELLREMRARGDLRRDADGAWIAGETVDWEAMPARVEAVIARRLGRLPADLHELLATASVEGESFTVPVLARVQGAEEGALLRRLATLETQHGLIREQAEFGTGTRRLARYHFNHILYQQYLYDQLSQAQRRILHGKIAAELETLYEANPEAIRARLAHHYAVAGNGQKAVPYLLRVGDQARALYAHREAIDHYRRALSFLKAQGEAQGAARTLMKLGLTHHTAFNYEEARRAYEEGFALWQRAGQAQKPAKQDPSRDLATLRLNWKDPVSLDPTMAPGLYSNGLASQLFSGLLALTPDLDVLPDVAQRWDVEEEGRRYVFHLRPDARWSDGVPLTAADFEFSWKRALDPATRSPLASTLLYDIAGAQAFHRGESNDPDQVGIHARDASTLVVELTQPTGYFPHLVAFPALFPTPRHLVQKEGQAWTRSSPLVSNGPFLLSAREPGFLQLERNPLWHRHHEGNVRQIAVTTCADADTLLQMYGEDELDVLNLWLMGPDSVATARLRHADEYLSGPQLLTYYVMFNLQQPPFADARVRQAFALAADRTGLAEVTLSGFLSPATGGFVPPGMPGHVPDMARPADVDEARRLLAEAGYAHGQGFPAVELLSRPGREYLALPLAEQWQQRLGVDVKLWEAPVPDLIERITQGDFALGLAAWLPDYPDPDCYLRVCMSLDAPQIGWRDERYEGLVQQARQLRSQEERIDLYRRAEQILTEEAPVLPATYGRLHLLLKPWVRRFHLSPMKQRFWHEVIIEREP